MIRNGVCGAAPSGTYQATIAPPRSTYLPPLPAAEASEASASQASVSETCRNPAFSRRSAAFATAWYGDGLAVRNVMRSSVWPRSKREGALMGFTLTTYESPLPVMGSGPS